MSRPASPPAGALVAVTGGTGFLGSHVCDRLLAAGLRVRTCARPTSNRRWLRDKPVEVVPATLDDPAAVDALLDGCAGAIHCAGAVAAPDEAAYRRVNLDLTRHLLEGCARAPGVGAFVYVSSLAAAGPAGPEAPRTETGPLAPISAYGRSKRDAEALVRDGAWPLRAAILRPPALYGPRDREFLPLLRAARHGWTVRPGRIRGLSLVDGRDAAAAAVALLVTPAAAGPYFVDDGPGPDDREAAGRRFPWGYAWPEVAAALGAACGRRLRSLPAPIGLLRAAAALPGGLRSATLSRDRVGDLRVEGWVCSAQRLRHDTGWRPARDLAAGLRDTRAFLEREGWL